MLDEKVRQAMAANKDKKELVATLMISGIKEASKVFLQMLKDKGL